MYQRGEAVWLRIKTNIPEVRDLEFWYIYLARASYIWRNFVTFNGQQLCNSPFWNQLMSDVANSWPQTSFRLFFWYSMVSSYMVGILDEICHLNLIRSLPAPWFHDLKWFAYRKCLSFLRLYCFFTLSIQGWNLLCELKNSL